MNALNNITLPNYMDEKTGLLYVRAHDSEKIRQSWKIDKSRILIFERIWSNISKQSGISGGLMLRNILLGRVRE
ncbi:hypothetical protein [Oceanobacillus sp. Castelsardo]|uniref:hypothetical protein n=1 Tax=Oceanobacillus sp. Castelsardo TaxID=1851204 RepID=UPI00083954DA|nr:hypothetical protein [Oceanobacillus sp. Castelsardo]